DRRLKAAVPGGSSMKILPAANCDVLMDFDSLAAAGTSLGSAGGFVLDAGTCIVWALHNVARFYAHESCGQCTPCREGSGWMVKIMNRIMDGMGRRQDLDMLLELEKTMGIMPGTTICGLADGTAWATRTFINKFYDEFAARCPE